VAIRVEKKKNGVWNVDYGDGIDEDFRDWEAAIDAAHTMAAKDRRGYLIIDRDASAPPLRCREQL